MFSCLAHLYRAQHFRTQHKIINLVHSSTLSYILIQQKTKKKSSVNDSPKYISAFTDLKNGLAVASKLANTLGSVRDRGNSISEIHGPVLRPLSEIDGLRSRLRRGQLPRYSISSLSYCHSCLGSEAPGWGERRWAVWGQKNLCIGVPGAQRAPSPPQ